ncbi:hypothetical protein [Azospirillum soli]|uniref:hypothetical protein n=1 Tax=Azospirillum soli TaxID=1304799 RepID=UPI001AE9E9E7|nr:hypothetical protein [Azospirillum soli]MBP2316802.1 translation initiation factor 6 (eIF-6) [Azospirillum soli]
MPAPIQPFASEADSVHIDELTVENQTDRVSLYGSLIVTRDKAGLANARALKAVLDAVVATLETDKTLPDTVATKPTDTVSDPWG